jgi:hypothetical protein
MQKKTTEHLFNIINKRLYFVHFPFTTSNACVLKHLSHFKQKTNKGTIIYAQDKVDIFGDVNLFIYNFLKIKTFKRALLR